MRQDHVLMCKPTYFDIEYSINPYMDVENKVDQPKAHKQWQEVYDVLEKHGVDIKLIDPVAGLPDMTFAGDGGIACNNKFVTSHFRHLEREPEAEAYRIRMEELGYEIFELPPEVYFEGLGDIVFSGTDVLCGYGPRSTSDSIEHIRKIFPEFNVLGNLYLKDPYFYHTALAIALLDKDTVLYYPEAFTPESCKFLDSSFKRSVPVSLKDAGEYFVCNHIPVKDQLIMDGCSDELEARLDKMGYGVIRCDMSEFKKSGGSSRCLILNI